MTPASHRGGSVVAMTGHDNNTARTSQRCVPGWILEINATGSEAHAAVMPILRADSSQRGDMPEEADTREGQAQPCCPIPQELVVAEET